MILKKLTLNNFRQFSGKQELNLNTDDDKNIIVIHGANGGGKTTILQAITWCLYGATKLEHLHNDSQFLNKHLFFDMKEKEEKKVSVQVIFNDKGNEYIIERAVLVQKQDTEVFKNSFPEVKVFINNELSNKAQEAIDSVLGSELKGYFFFKGEGVHSLAEDENSFKIKEGIKNIMKIQLLKDLVGHIHEVRKGFNKELKKINVNEIIPEDELEMLQSNKLKIEEDIVLTKENIHSFNTSIKDLRVDLEKVLSIKGYLDEKKTLEENIEVDKKRNLRLNEQIKTSIAKNSFLAISKNLINNIEERLNLKRTKGELPIGIRDVFINDILEKKVCICGQSFTDGDSLYKNINNLLETTSKKTLNEISINDISSFLSTKKEVLNNFNSSLKEIQNEIYENSMAISKKESQIIEVDKKIGKNIPKNYEQLNINLKRYEIDKNDETKKLGALGQKFDELDKQIKEKQKEIEASKAKTDEERLVKDRIQLCINSENLINSEIDKKVDLVREELSVKLNKLFKEIIHKNREAIINEDFELKIKEFINNHQQNAIKSDGENKIISLLFIASLVELAKEYEDEKKSLGGAGIYPIVIDSPFGDLDDIYQKSISIVLQRLAPQVILLLNPAQWKFVERYISTNVKEHYILNIHRPYNEEQISDSKVVEINDKNYALEIEDTYEYTKIKNLEV